MQHGHATMETQDSRHSHLSRKLSENWPIQNFILS